MALTGERTMNGAVSIIKERSLFRNILITFAVFSLIVSHGFMNNTGESVAFADSTIEVNKNDYESNYINDPEYSVVNTRYLYRYRTRNKETIQSGNSSMNGYTLYDKKTTESTSDYKFGTPISTNTSISNDGKSSITKSAVNTGYYYYAYTAANPNKTSDWTYYASSDRATVVSHMKASFSAASAWSEANLRYFWWIDSSSNLQNTAHLNKKIYYSEDSNVKVGSTKKESSTHNYDLALYKYKQCYKEKTVTTSYYYYRYTAWSPWSDWSAYCPSSNDLTESQSMLFYTLEYHETKHEEPSNPVNPPSDSGGRTKDTTAKSSLKSKRALPGVSLVKVSRGRRSFVAKWKKASKKQQKKFSGYQIQYSTRPDFSSKVKTKKTKKKAASRVVIRKLKKRTQYYVRIRRYKKSGRKTIYSNWSNVKLVKTR